jgi:hypothetical protein
MNPSDHIESERVIAHSRAWLERVVIGLNLCPFAKAVHARGQIRSVVCDATDPDSLLTALRDELDRLATADPTLIDTTLLIHPRVLTDFDAYNQFLDQADAALVDAGLEGVIQVASFHPDYRFAGSAADDIDNATNRSPYPMLHLLREASVERAVQAFPDAAAIYQRNILTLRTLGTKQWRQLMRECFAAGVD